jgi:histidinol-phosphatase (PHP family)
MCVEAGADFALSSDAHTPDQVGYAFDQAIDFLEDLGVDRICVFEGRRRRIEPLGRAGGDAAEVSGPGEASG